MQGLMHSSPLTVDRILRHAAAAHGQAEVVTAAPEGAPRRISYALLESRVRRLAGALAESGIGKGDVVAVIGASSARQIEAWFAIMTTGAVCHPINPARSPEQAAALMRAHGDKAVLVDPDLLQGLEPSLLKLPQLERVIAMGEAGQALATRMHAVVSQDALMETAGRTLAGAPGEEGMAALLLHSAGVAEAPKAALWSHRACVLQGLAAQGPDGLGLSSDDSVLSLTPFWRYAAGGLVFAAPLAGARLVLPGQKLDVQSIRILADRETATVVVGAPAELQALHDQFRSEGRRPSSLTRVIAVGAPAPHALARAWRDSFGVEVWSAWGAAEVAGVAAVARGASGLLPLFGVELELLDADGRPRPHDGVAIGRLTARGPLVSGSDGSGPIDTGDLATIDPQGRIALLGRADEQVIAAGVQIPSWPIEAAALEHPATARAAAIDPPRGLDAEGPVLVVERNPGALAGKPEYLRFLAERLGGLRLGDLLFVNGFPLDSVGRIDKPVLRQRLEQLIAPNPPPASESGPEPEAAEPAPAYPAPETFTSPAAPVLAAAAITAAPILFKDEAPHPEAAPTPEPEAPAEIAESDPAIEAAPSAEPDTEALETAPAEPLAAHEPLALGPLGAAAPEPATASPADPDQSLFLRIDNHPHEDRRKARRKLGRVELFLNLMAVLAVAPAVLILIGALGVRFDLIDWPMGVGKLILDWPSKVALIGVLGGIFAVFAAGAAGFGKYGLRAAISLVLPLAMLAALAWLKSVGDSYPPTHDVATNWTQPLAFSPALLRERGSDAYPVEDDPIVPASSGAYMNRRVAEVNGETCPGARPVPLTLPPAEAYAKAKAAVLAEGLELYSDSPASGRLEATATGTWLGLKDDLAVRVTATATGSQIDLRSVSRGGLADFGDNCRRVTGLVKRIG
ncbi:MAG TPA: AMP-binding protein [Caulobacteraceae bacterium]